MNRDQYFTQIGDRLHSDELAYVQKAYWLVKEAHRKQSRRLTGERFFEHVRRVSYSAGVTFGYCDAQTLALGLLHDTIEDTYVPQSVLAGLFGHAMYDEILALSKEIPSFHPVTGKLIARAKLDNASYYGALTNAPLRPRVIKGCDRIDNLQDVDQWEPARRDKYILETESFVLPLIKRTDLRIAGVIQGRIEAAVAAPSASLT